MIAARNATKGRTTAMRFTVRSTLVMSWTLPTTEAADWRVHARPGRCSLELRHKFFGNRAQARHRFVELVVGKVRSRPQPQVAPAAVARHAGRRERPLQRPGVRRLEREEARHVLERRVAVAREHR